jgi:CelD/BcsL family acetyltransferase involved in cellulose biosynthesis
MVLLARVLESAFEEWARTFDFLLGDESYKSRFADETRPVHDVTLARVLPHPASLVTGAEFGLRNLGRRVLPASVRGRLARRSLLGSKDR